MSGISTHVLDTSIGRPVVGMTVHLLWEGSKIGSAVSDENGRCPALWPFDGGLSPGTYRLVFETAVYFPDGFYPEVSIAFRVSDVGSHYHVPLLLSPFGFTTYRGS